VVLCNAPLRSFVGLLWVLCGSFAGPLRSFAVLCGPLWSFAVLCGPLRYLVIPIDWTHYIGSLLFLVFDVPRN